MTTKRPTTTVQVMPEDSDLIEATRLWLQRRYGSNHSKADAVHYAMMNLAQTNPSIFRQHTITATLPTLPAAQEPTP